MPSQSKEFFVLNILSRDYKKNIQSVKDGQELIHKKM